ncbi:MAG TPA: dihydropteroate synthase-like protein [Candidatus Altiarchaeales archaeon]|nr:dihydropteroate synthase-like protein [Candidatus Altiarchaeales archaeon]
MKKQKIEKVLLLTGRLASKDLHNLLAKTEAKNLKIDVEVLPIDVAAMITPSFLLKHLNRNLAKKYDLIIVPGHCSGDFSKLEKLLGAKVVKGTKNLADLSLMLSQINTKNFSSREDADSILRKEIKRNAEKELENYLKLENFQSSRAIITSCEKKIYLGVGMPKIVAEIPNAPLLGEEEVKKIAKHYVNSGADIINLGMIPNEDNSSILEPLISSVREVAKLPIAIDSLNKDEILTAIENNINLVLSLDPKNYSLLNEISPEKISSLAFVVIPARENFPIHSEKRAETMMKFIKKIKSNYPKVNLIADPILDLNSFLESILAYKIIREAEKDLPMLIGIGNITELMDIDSIGINGILTFLAYELDVDLIFTTEASDKTFNAVKEINLARKMFFLAKKKKQFPKDLGIDLLRLKEKRKRRDLSYKDENVPLVIPKPRETKLEDVEFKIYIDNSHIFVVIYKEGKAVMKLKGKNAKELYLEIIAQGFIKELSHAAYLGKELEKAEIALKLGRSYVQDEDLF